MQFASVVRLGCSLVVVANITRKRALLLVSQMVEVIHWCIELGVKYISVYAFSIDNFQRSPDEVGSLMHLAEAKYDELAKVGTQGHAFLHSCWTVPWAPVPVLAWCVPGIY